MIRGYFWYNVDRKMKLKKYVGLGTNSGDYLYIFECDETEVTLHIRKGITIMSYGENQIDFNDWKQVNNLVPMSVVYRLVKILTERRKDD